MFRAVERLGVTLSIAAIAFCPLSPARADVFDDARQTFQKDVPHFFQSDVPHFFQDDIPCAFGGQPTSHTKTSCRSRPNSVLHEPDGNPADIPARPGEGQPSQDPPVYDK